MLNKSHKYGNFREVPIAKADERAYRLAEAASLSPQAEGISISLEAISP